MKSQRIYISGPISGRDLDEVKAHFANAEKMLQEKSYKTINPLKMRLPLWLARHGHYRLCLLLELVWLAYRANAIYLLDGWQQSGGARTERSLAMALDIKLMYENYKKKTISKDEMAKRLSDKYIIKASKATTVSKNKPTSITEQ